jgi:hypothetical protein
MLRDAGLAQGRRLRSNLPSTLAAAPSSHASSDPALPRDRRQLRVTCPPLTPFERRLLRVRANVDGGEGWLRAAAAGASAPPPGALPGTPPSKTAAAGAPPPLALPAPGGEGGGGAAGGGTAAPGGCSEYAARLGEAVYACADHALRFLSLTSPQLDPREVAEAGGMWPKKPALAALQVGAAAARPGRARRARRHRQ